jgi:ArsR family transcriptional regulator
MHGFFKVIGDETRLRCLAIIVKHHEVCVCELVEALALPQSKISRHLALIKSAGIITQRRLNQWVLYSLSAQLSHLKHQLLEQTVLELLKSDFYQLDDKRLLKMRKRPEISCRKQQHEFQNV